MSNSNNGIGFSLIHGGGLNCWVWEDLQPHLSLPSLALHRFPSNANRRKLSLSDCAQIAIKQMEEAEFSRSILVAHSIGGILAMEIAKQRPELVAGVVFVAANVPNHNGTAMDAFAFGQRMQIRIGQFLAACGIVPIKAMQDWMKENLGHDLSDEDNQRLVENAGNLEPSSLFFRPVSNQNILTIPRAYVTLSQDRTLSPKTQRQMAKRIGAENHQLDCGHAPMLGKPKELADILNQFAQNLHS